MMSPLDINTNPYHTLPMAADSAKSAVYASLSFNTGGSNQQLKDDVVGGRAELHRAHQFGNFQAFYGAGLSLGNYHVADVYHLRDAYYNSLNDTVYHYENANKLYGSYGLYGGINIVIPFGNGRGEWRMIGLETSFQKEFGEYVQYRKNLPDSAYNVLAAYDRIFSIGGMTEIVGKTRNGTEVGYKLAIGSILFPGGDYRGDARYDHPFYVSNTLHVTKQKVTGFLQLNAGVHAASFQFGVNYNLGRR
jgi:hypothetical protein